MSSNIISARCKKTDFNFVYNLTRQTLYQYITRYKKWSKKGFIDNFNKNHQEIKILYIGKKRIGLYMLENQKDHLDLQRIFLIKSYRGRGIGTYLLKRFEKRTKKKYIRLEVWKGNPAIKVYKKLGYKIIKMVEGKYKMEKKLK